MTIMLTDLAVAVLKTIGVVIFAIGLCGLFWIARVLLVFAMISRNPKPKKRPPSYKEEDKPLKSETP